MKGGAPRTALVEHHKPQKLEQLLNLELPQSGKGKEGLLKSISDVLQYSVNTWDQGFLDKLYASTDAVGVVSELVLAVLNTNLHVYQVSPALTLIEKKTTRALAELFGLKGPHAGGISVQGGSASNVTSIVIARNTLYPETKQSGNSASPSGRLVLFTSVHGHYSIEKAAQILGLGSSAVVSVAIDSEGCMIPSALSDAIKEALSAGDTPFYVNATAGTTVLGSYDPFEAISDVCKENNVWLHIDASWGGPAIFSQKHSHKLKGSDLADSIAINPHKMMGVPLTCSFLLAADLRKFHQSNTLPAKYLFHDEHHTSGGKELDVMPEDIYDLADLTLQCGRRGDSLKLYLSWLYYGSDGYASQIDKAFTTAEYLASKVADHPDLSLVSSNPPPCLQVCFYYAPNGKLCPESEGNSECTKSIAASLVREGWMIDYADADLEGRQSNGLFFRVVVNRDTRMETVDGLLLAIEKVGSKRYEGVHPKR